jgi:hypothetical protein
MTDWPTMGAFSTTCGASHVVGVAALAPQLDQAADGVDSLVLFDAVLGPFIEGQLPFFGRLAGFGDGDEVLADSPLGDDSVGDALLVEAKMPRGFLEGRVDDRVFDDNLRHGWAAFQRVRHGRRRRGSVSGNWSNGLPFGSFQDATTHLGNSVTSAGLDRNRGTTSMGGTVQSRIATRDLLLNLGFVVDPAVISDSKPGLSYDFGILKLEASHGFEPKIARG